MVLEIQFGTPEYDEALKLRYQILRAPLGLDFEAEQIELEYALNHFAHFDAMHRINGYFQMVAREAGAVQMKQVAVAENTQKHGIGTTMVLFSEAWARQNNFQEIVLHARDTAMPFYSKLGYDTVGEPFTEVGIEHYYMKKVL